jgi:hypothetical protein
MGFEGGGGRVDDDRRAAAEFAREVRRLVAAGSTTESSYYPAIKALWSRLLDSRNLPFDVRAGTSEERSGVPGTDLPDLALYDAGEFPAVFGEAKLLSATLPEMCVSTGRNDQIGRYLAQTGVVLLTNVRGVGLAACKPNYKRESGRPVPPSQRELLDTVDFWPSKEAILAGDSIAGELVQRLGDLLERAVTEFAPIAEPSSLARILARQARRAKADVPETFDAVAPLLEDYRAALGLTFDEEHGLEFFRSSLIQTAYYGIFVGWTLWHRARDGRPFEWERMGQYLKIPFLGQLFYDLAHQERLAELHLGPHLDRAAETLRRVDRNAFFTRFRYATLEDTDTLAALTYFYEPFLEAFDPDLRKELGVYYTPPEIVRYQVRTIDRLLREELGCRHGFADPRVIVLDPACGTGAYLIEVARCIAADLRRRGEGELLGAQLREALTTRLHGFEILTAPFVVSQLQLYLLLDDLGVTLPAGERPAVFLTNALTGWEETKRLKLNFPELKKEHDAAHRVKREAKIIVILGNPPYRRFVGTALDEEADLVDHYKGITRRPKKDRRGDDVLDADGKPVMVQVGESLLYKRWGIVKQLLDELYIRFFRLAEKHIGEDAEYGIVSFISNSSYLTGRSHPIMRESLLRNFHEVRIDNTHGNRLASERTPWGDSCETLFSFAGAAGIKVGTCISTFIKKKAPPTPPEKTPVFYRDFWGRADGKRHALMESLDMQGWRKPRRDAAAGTPEGPRDYERFFPTEAARWKFSPRDFNAGYEAWAALDELFPATFQGVNPNRGLDGSLVDVDRAALAERMRHYYSAATFAEVQRRSPELVAERARYTPKDVWKELRTNKAKYVDARLVPYLVFPLDLRWLYYETDAKLLNERRPEFWENLSENEFLLAVPQCRRPSESRSLLARTLVDLHAHDRGAVCFPRATRAGTLVTALTANLNHRAWSALQAAFGLSGTLTSDEAINLVGSLFRCALAVFHAPRFESDYRDALTQDWAHLPIPKERADFDRLTALGQKVANLLDPQADAEPTIEQILGRDRVRTIAVPRGEGANPDLRVTISYFGAGKGKWTARPYSEEEEGLPAWGDGTGDLWISRTTYFANVPERVWKHELGGYPVLKKWLGYRAARDRDGKPLTLDETRYFRSMVQRLAALIGLQDELDTTVEQIAAVSFTAEELGLRSA